MGSRLDIESHDHITAQLADSVIRELAAARNKHDRRIGAWLEVGFQLGVERPVLTNAAAMARSVSTSCAPLR